MSQRDQDRSVFECFKRYLNESGEIEIPVRIVPLSLGQRTRIIRAAQNAVAEAQRVLKAHLKSD